MADGMTSTTRAGLSAKLDQIVDRMVAEGLSDEEIQDTVDDFKAKYFTEEPAGPSLGSLTGTAALQFGKSLVTAPINLVREAWNAKDPVTLARRLVIDPAVAQGRKAYDAYGQGRYSEAAGHGLATLLPVVGPIAAEIGEQVGTADPVHMAQGAGNLTALLAAGPITRGAGRAAGATGRALQNAGVSGWQRAAKIPKNVTEQTPAYRKTGNLQAGDRQIAETVLSRNRGTLSDRNVRAIEQEATDAGRRVGDISNRSTATMPAADMLKALDEEIAAMTLAEAPTAQLTAARARRNELAERWAAEDRAVGVAPAGGVQIDPATAARVRQQQLADFRDMVNRPPMRQAEAPSGVPGATFDAVYPRRPPATQAGLNEGHALPDPIRMGGHAGEYTPIRVATEPTFTPLSSAKVQAMKRAGDARESPLGAAEASAARKWQDAHVPGLAAAKEQFATLTPAAEAVSGARSRITKADPMSPFQMLLAMTPPGWIATAQRPGPLSFLSQRTYNAGRRLGGAEAPLTKAGTALRIGNQWIPGGRVQPFGAALDPDEEARRLMIERLSGAR